jgi:hypothetical protein
MVEFSTADIAALTDYELVDGYTMVSNEITGEWRWGHWRTLIFSHGGQLYGYEYRTAAGAGEWVWAGDEGDFVKCFKVVAREAVRVEYQRAEG